MKRLKLLIAACALTVGSAATWAATDITSTYLTNADLATKGGTWTCVKYTDWQTATDASHVNVVEFWAGSGYTDNKFEISQTAKLPAGYYRLAVNAFYRNGWGGDGTNNNNAWIFAGTKTQNVYALNSGDLDSYTAGGIGGSDDLQKASNAFYQGKFSNEFDFSLTEETEISIGFAGQNFTGGSWCIFGPVKLYEYTAADYIEDYRAKANEAKALYDKPMNAEVLAALKAAVVEESTLTTVDDVTNAIQTLTTAINSANTSISYYATLKSAIDEYATKVAALDATAQAAYDISSVNTAYTDGTATDGATEIAAIKAAYVVAVKAQTTAGSVFTEAAPTDWTGATGNYNDGGTTRRERYNTAMYTGDVMTQTIENVPNGEYSVVLYTSAAYTSGRGFEGNTGDNLTVAFVNEQTVNKAVVEGGPNFESQTVKGFVQDGTLKYGLKNIANGGNWFVIALTSITYNGETEDYLASFAASLKSAVSDAKALYASLPTAAKSALETVVTENDKTYETSGEYMTATAAVRSAIATAETFVTPYSTYKAKKAIVEAIEAQDVYTGAEAKATLDGVISSSDTNVEATTTATAVETETANLLAAVKTFIGAVTINADACFDLTGLIENPTFENSTADGWTYGADGFSSTDGVAEYYQTAFDFNQTIADMPKGNYELRVKAFQRQGDNATAYTNYKNGTTVIDSKIYINEGETTIKNVMAESSDEKLQTEGWEGWQDYQDSEGDWHPNGRAGAAKYFALGKYENTILTAVDGTLKLGFKGVAGSSYWTCFDDFRLYYYGNSISIAMNETDGYTAVSDIENANVTLTRTIYEGWNTIVLPFEADPAQFGATKLYKYTGDNESLQLTFAEATTIEPNVPYLLKASADKSDAVVFSGVTVKQPTEAIAAGTGYNFVGTFAGVKVADGDFILGADAFYRSNGGNNVKPFRAYIQKVAESAPARLAIVLDGETTSIEAIDGKAVNNAAIYNLAGQKVEKAQKGVYIQNGRKVIVK